MNEQELRRIELENDLVKLDEKMEALINRLEIIQGQLTKNNKIIEDSNRKYKERLVNEKK